MRLLVATGLRREARALERAGVTVIPGGGDGTGLERKLEQALAAGGFDAVLSSGLAGALDPALAPGDIVLDGDPALVDTFARLLPDARRGGIAGSDIAIATAEAKATLRSASGALAVDMESHIAARVAARHGAPFAAIRTISDKAGDALPPAALKGMRPDGGVALGAVLGSLACNPAQLPALLRTARDAGKGFRALEDIAAALGRITESH